MANIEAKVNPNEVAGRLIISLVLYDTRSQQTENFMQREGTWLQAAIDKFYKGARTHGVIANE